MLFIWVEGDDDQTFFQNVLEAELKGRYDAVVVRKYAQLQPRQVVKLIRSVQSMGHKYIFVADIHAVPCVTSKKATIARRYGCVDQERIAVVVKEIESWYLAGLDAEGCRQLGLRRPPRTTDEVTKDRFDALIPGKYDSRTDFMHEILKRFSVTTAKRKNKSFRYFMRKHVACEPQ